MSAKVVLPGWAEELKIRYIAGEAGMFLLNGNVRDLYPWTTESGVEYLRLRQF